MINRVKSIIEYVMATVEKDFFNLTLLNWLIPIEIKTTYNSSKIFSVFNG
jgi:hypothetical protein